MIDTLKLSKGLQKAGMPDAQADAIAEAINESEGSYVTRQDLESAVSRLELRLTKLIDDARHHTLLAIGLLVLAQIGLHFWK
jgi:hypothetical protein